MRAAAPQRGLDGPKELERMLDALKRMSTAILDLEQARHQFVHCGGNQN